MLIRYTGPKVQKVVEYNGKNHLFLPDDEVTDPVVLRFLLSPDMKGLFIVVTPQMQAEEAKKKADALLGDNAQESPGGSQGKNRAKKKADALLGDNAQESPGGSQGKNRAKKKK